MLDLGLSNGLPTGMTNGGGFTDHMTWTPITILATKIIDKGDYYIDVQHYMD